MNSDAAGHGKDSAEISPMGPCAADQYRRVWAKIILRSSPLPCFDVDHQSDFGNVDAGAACALLPLMTLLPPRIDCSRSRNSSVTAPASTLLRMSRVLMKIMISDLDLLLEVFPNSSPRNLISRRPGMPDRVFWSRSLIRPASSTV